MMTRLESIQQAPKGDHTPSLATGASSNPIQASALTEEINDNSELEPSRTLPLQLGAASAISDVNQASQNESFTIVTEPDSSVEIIDVPLNQNTQRLDSLVSVEMPAPISSLFQAPTVLEPLQPLYPQISPAHQVTMSHPQNEQAENYNNIGMPAAISGSYYAAGPALSATGRIVGSEERTNAGPSAGNMPVYENSVQVAHIAVPHSESKTDDVEMDHDEGRLRRESTTEKCVPDGDVDMIESVPVARGPEMAEEDAMGQEALSQKPEESEENGDDDEFGSPGSPPPPEMLLADQQSHIDAEFSPKMQCKDFPVQMASESSPLPAYNEAPSSTSPLVLVSAKPSVLSTQIPVCVSPTNGRPASTTERSGIGAQHTPNHEDNVEKKSYGDPSWISRAMSVALGSNTGMSHTTKDIKVHQEDNKKEQVKIGADGPEVSITTDRVREFDN